MNKEVFIVIAIIYLVLINLLGFGIMGMDKQRAKKGMYRIPEKTLFLAAILGGCFGTTAGMYFFHHKTRHWYFKFGMPLFCVGWGYCILKIFCL